MNKKQTEQFKRTLKRGGFLPWTEPEKSRVAVAEACRKAVELEGAVFFNEFYEPINQHIQELYDSGKILKTGWSREPEKFYRAAYRDPIIEKKQIIIAESFSERRRTLTEHYLDHVRKSESRGFDLKRVVDILRIYFEGSADEFEFALNKPNREELFELEDYVALFEKIRRISEPSQRGGLFCRVSHPYRYSRLERADTPREAFEKDMENRHYYAEAMLKGGGCDMYKGLLKSYKRRLENRLVAYTSSDDAVSLIKADMPIGQPRTKRVMVFPITL